MLTWVLFVVWAEGALEYFPRSSPISFAADKRLEDVEVASDIIDTKVFSMRASRSVRVEESPRELNEAMSTGGVKLGRSEGGRCE